jgi:hypothetical protein
VHNIYKTLQYDWYEAEGSGSEKGGDEKCNQGVIATWNPNKNQIAQSYDRSKDLEYDDRLVVLRNDRGKDSRGNKATAN